MKKKKQESKSSAKGPGGLSKAQIKVYTEIQQSGNKIYQNFRLVTSNVRLLQYFVDDKYLGYHILENAMSKYYIGDGENIIYRDKIYYNNLIAVIFEKIGDIEIPKDLNAQFTVEAPIPANTGCKECEHYRQKHRTCLYYQQIGIDLKKSCSDFKQKR